MSNYDDEEWQELKDYYADDGNWIDDDADYRYDDDDYSSDWEIGFHDGYNQALKDIEANKLMVRLIQKMKNWWYTIRHPMDDIPF